MPKNSGFTLIELLIVIAILSILGVGVIFILNPAEKLKETRDITRLSDLKTIHNAISIYALDSGSSFGNPQAVYTSLPDSSPTCSSYALPTLPGGWAYACAPSSTYRLANSTGWIPINFSQISFGPPLNILPTDPINTAEGGLYYTYVNGSWELTAKMESSAYKSGGSKDVETSDKGDTNQRYELGSTLTVSPDIGTGAVAEPDTTPPLPPTSLTATPTSSSAIILAWNPSPEPDLAGYKVYRCDGSGCSPTNLLTTTINPSYFDTNLAASTAYTYAVSAYDNASPSNESAKSSSQFATTLSSNEVIGLIRQNCTGYTNCYTSLSAWETAYGGISFTGCTTGDLTCVNKIAIAQIDGAWTAADATALTIDGWTTGPANYIKIYTAPAARHQGKWDATKYNRSSSITISEDYVRIDGLQISMAPTGNVRTIYVTASVSSAASDTHISNNIIRTTSISGTYNRAINVRGGTLVKIWNNIIYNWTGTSSYGIEFESGTPTAYLYNNTVYNCQNSFMRSVGTVIAKNNISNNCVSGFVGTFAAGSDYNISNLAADAPGANSKNSTNVSFFDVINNDFHLLPGDTAAKDAGVNLSSDLNLAFSLDIDNNARPQGAAWDIGADEEASGLVDTQAPTIPTNLLAIPISSSQINLSWTVSTDLGGGIVAGYKIYRCQGTCTPSVQVGTSPTSPFSDTNNFSPNTTYSYAISAYDNAIPSNESLLSSPPVSTTTQSLDTQKPSTSTLTATAVSPVQISLSWTAATDDVGVTGYEIFRCQGGGCTPTFFATSTGTGTTYQNTNLSPSTEYSYKVRAYDAALNMADLSNIASAITQAFTANIYYISPTGSDTNNGTSPTTPIKTFLKAFGNPPGTGGLMTFGDELVLLDGTYSVANGTGYINYNDGSCSSCAQPPSGLSLSQMTYVHAQNPGSVNVDGGSQQGLFIGRSTRKDSYIKIDGITFYGGGSLYNADYVTVKNSGFYSATQSAGRVFGIGTNGHEMGSNYNLIEDVWAWGRERIVVQNYRSDHNVWRRVVYRNDGCYSSTLGCGNNAGNQMVGSTIYNSNNITFENLIGVDSIPGPNGYLGAGDFFTAWHDNYFYPWHSNEWLGTISLNNQLGSGYGYDLDGYSTSPNLLPAQQPMATYKDIVAWNSSGGAFGAQLGCGTCHPHNINVSNGTFNLSASAVSSDGFRISNMPGTQNVSNIVVIGNGRYGVNSVSQPSYVDLTGTWQSNYNQTTCAVGCKTTDPLNDGIPPSIKYITRIEDGSVLDGTGYGGADYGANIVNRYGVNGARWNEAGYNTLTSNPLWPWPNETRIKKEMCTDMGETRGFCSAQSITKYIWEYLGSPSPY